MNTQWTKVSGPTDGSSARGRDAANVSSVSRLWHCANAHRRIKPRNQVMWCMAGAQSAESPTTANTKKLSGTNVRTAEATSRTTIPQLALSCPSCSSPSALPSAAVSRRGNASFVIVASFDFLDFTHFIWSIFRSKVAEFLNRLIKAFVIDTLCDYTIE